MEYTRESLIKICKKAIVPQSEWRDRDSAMSQEGVGKALVFLKAGCEFEVKTKDNTRDKSGCITDDKTIWIQFWVKDFNWYEYGESDGSGKLGNASSDYHFYLPTMERIKKRKGKDWY